MLSPADLAEDVDLPFPLKKEILAAEALLADENHWAVLGLRWNATAQAARAAYLEKVKVFHPDRYTGRRLGSYLGRIERVFRALTEARDVLTDEARRVEYVRRTAPPEEFARMEARRLESEQRADERRRRLARANPLVARAARVQELVARGKESMAIGRYAAAANDFLTALGIDPRHPEAHALVAEAKRRVAAEKADELFKRALAAEAVGNRSAALESFHAAVEADPHTSRYAVAASRFALSAGDPADARTFADAAIRAAPRDPRALEALGAALAALGEKAEAKRTLERALEIDATLEGAKEILRKLRWSFLR